jgi:sialic acid synthase SpsE
MVDAIHRAGARIVKHQTHVVDDEMSPLAREVKPGNADISIYEIMRSCALSENDEYELMRYTEKQGMLFLSTPFSRAAADRLRAFGVSAYKIGSGECNNHPLVEYIASFGKPMIVSTGMNNLASVRKTSAILERRGVQYAFLHTTNLYPTPPHLVRLGAMLELASAFPEMLFGLSDHTVNNNACLAATALGACILERHFTDSRTRLGPDIACSMDEEDLRLLIAGSREIALMRGGRKEPASEEAVTMNFAFATVVALRDIKRGEKFDERNTWVKRPGVGDIPAERYREVLGKVSAADIPQGKHLNSNMIKGGL